MLKRLCNVYRTLFAAAALGLLAAGGVSCGHSDGEAAPVEAVPSHDTLALVEGLRFFEEHEYDLARDQLTVSARSSSTYIRAESFLYLNALEMELGNYDRARVHLDRYHSETMRMLRSAADSSRRMEQQAARLRRRHDTFVGGMIIVGILVIGAAVFVARRKRDRTVDLQKDISATVDENHFPLPGWARWLDDAAAFGQTEIYAEIATLATQKPGRDARVLTLARQDVLDAELAERFAEMSATLRHDYPTLTAGDVKLCCLSLLPLTPFGRALCWGSTETNIIKQRKHTIKKKLWIDERGRALFGFIFGERR